MENLPQFIIQFAEMFIFKTSISFTQAGFPLISLMLIYHVTAPITALLLYNHLLWDGKPSKKEQFGLFFERKERDTFLLLILVAL